MRVSGMPLFAAKGDKRRDRTTPPNLDCIPNSIGIGGFSNQTAMYIFTRFADPIDDGDSPIDSGTFFITGNQQTNGATGQQRFSLNRVFKRACGRGHPARHATFHIFGAAPKQPAIPLDSGKGIVRPISRVAHRHDINMAAKTKVRCLRAKANIQVVHLSPRQASALSTQGFSPLLNNIQRPTGRWRNARLLDERLR